MAQQTAVEWLLEQIRINKLTFYKEGDNKISITLTGKDVVEQAKQMEKEQKIEFADRYADDVMAGCLLRADQYYNETYGK